MITRMVTCWKIRLLSGEKLFFTDCDHNLFIEEEEYVSGGCFTPNSIINSSELAQDNFTISGVIDNNFITKDSLFNGNFTNAYLEIFLVDLMKNSLKKIILKTGWLGEIKLANNSFIIEVSSLSAKTNNLIGKCYSATCRTEFGDQFCKKKIEDYTFLGKIDSILEDNSFVDSKRNEPDDYFNKGILIFIDNGCHSKKYNILSFCNKIFTIDTNINLKLQKGDKYKVIVGCDKSLDTCVTKFNNSINFRGDPYVPGRYKLLACN